MSGIADEIELESATATAEEMAAALGDTRTAKVSDVETRDAVEDKPKAEAPVAAAVVAPVAAVVPATDARSEFERKVDELDPPLPDETPAQRTVRMGRGERRILGLLSRTKSTEDQLTEARAEIARLKTAPANPAPASPAPKGDEPPVEPPFVFPDWNTYSEKNPEATHEQYIDARQDARLEHKTAFATAKEEHDARARVTRERETSDKALNDRRTQHVDAFRAANPTYDDAMQTLMDVPLTPAVSAALDDLDDLAPAVLMHYAAHKDDYLAVLKLRPTAQAVAIHEIARTLKAAEAPAPEVTPAPATSTVDAPAAPAARPTVVPKPALPSRPSSDAPNPTSVVSGGAQPTVDLTRLAAEDDDADGYIAARTRQRQAVGLRR